MIVVMVRLDMTVRTATITSKATDRFRGTSNAGRTQNNNSNTQNIASNTNFNHEEKVGLRDQLKSPPLCMHLEFRGRGFLNP